MGYKPKYAASSRKREPDVIRTRPEPEKKASRPKQAQSRAGRIFQIILTVILVPVCTFASVRLLGWMLETVGRPKAAAISKIKNIGALDDFDAYVEHAMSQVDSGLKVSHLGIAEQTQPTEEETEPVREHYTIPEDALVAPKPNPSCYGQVDSPAEMEPILKNAKWILDGQKTYFQTNQQIYEEGQKNLKAPFSYEVPSFDLKEYGTPSSADIILSSLIR